MKRIFTYFVILASGLVLAASCSKNTPPVFDDAQAFVAFDVPATSVAEAIVKPNTDIVPQEKNFKVAVTLASVKGLSETVKFTIKEDAYLYKSYVDPNGDLEDKSNWVDKTAHSGVNFNLVTTSGTLTFDEKNRTQYIEFQILYVPEYTGDLKFDIELSKPESVDLGFNKTCTVTVADVNHPLTAMLGEYTMTGESYWSGVESWTMTILKDEEDDHMVWLNNLHNGATLSSLNVYGTVDEDMTTLTIPYGQATQYIYSSFGTPVLFCNFNGDLDKTGNMVIQINKKEDDDKVVTGLTFDENSGIWLIALNEDETDNANFAIYLPGTLSAKKN